MNSFYLTEIIIIVFAALLGGITAKRYGQPLIVGYILSGLIVGSVFGKFFRDIEFLEIFSDVGLALLLFSLGLELSFSKILRAKKPVILAAISQIILTILLGLIIFPSVFKLGFYESLFLASVFSLSSTAVVSKMLFERGSLNGILGDVMISWLLVQDIAVIPMVVILPSIGIMGGSFFLQFILSVVKAFILIYTGLWLGKKILPYIFEKNLRFYDSELILLASFVFGIGGALASHLLGLSYALGAFFAGSLLSPTALNLKVFSEIRPLRYLFTTIFFVVLGFLFDFSFFINNFFLILAITAFVISIKFLIISTTLLYLKYHSRIAVYSGIGMFQVGEFAYVLGRVGLTRGSIDQNIVRLIVSVSILSLILTPLLYNKSEKIYLLIKKHILSRMPKLHENKDAVADHVRDKGKYNNHVVLVGYGRVGKYIFRGLKLSKRQVIVIDLDFYALRDLKYAGEQFIFGDPTDIRIFEKSLIKKAKLLVIAIPDALITQQMINNARFLNPRISIITRAHNEYSAELIRSRGVREVVEPEFEASISMARRAMGIMKVDDDRAGAIIKELRKKHHF